MYALVRSHDTALLTVGLFSSFDNADTLFTLWQSVKICLNSLRTSSCSRWLISSPSSVTFLANSRCFTCLPLTGSDCSSVSDRVPTAHISTKQRPTNNFLNYVQMKIIPPLIHLNKQQVKLRLRGKNIRSSGFEFDAQKTRQCCFIVRLWFDPV